MDYFARSQTAQYPPGLIRLSICALVASVILTACGGGDESDTAAVKDPAEVVYKNAKVLTVDKNNTVAEAVGVRDGKILAVGTMDQLKAHVGLNTRVVDLQGKTLAPGFYDAHSHFSLAGTNAKYETDLNSPPISTVKNMDDIVALLQKKRAELGPDAWITGFGYDDTLLAENRHPTRADLDRVSTTQPVFVTHISAHMAVANSFALALAGIDRNTPDPAGGVIGKDGAGEPTGFLSENAQSLVSGKKPRLTAEQTQEGIAAAAQMYAAKGVTTANEGAGTPTALEQAAVAGKLSLRVMVWAGTNNQVLKSGKVKVGGVKQFYDGSIQGFTGYLRDPYHTPYEGDATYRGFARTTKAAMMLGVENAHKAGRQVFIHANGDQAIDDVLEAFRAAQTAYPRSDTRHTVIHAQMAREDQLDEMQALGVIPSFFQLHTYYWGDRHRDIFLGPDRGRRISPTHSAQLRNLPFTVHADTPIVPMDPILMLWGAVNRISTSGAVIGPEQRLSPAEALRALTINPAHQNFEEKERGSIEVGKWADLVVLSDNPMTVDSMKIRDIQVLETILEGKTIFEKKGS